MERQCGRVFITFGRQTFETNNHEHLNIHVCDCVESPNYLYQHFFFFFTNHEMTKNSTTGI